MTFVDGWDQSKFYRAINILMARDGTVGYDSESYDADLKGGRGTMALIQIAITNEIFLFDVLA